MTKIEEIKDKIKVLTDSSEKLKKEVLDISKKVGELKDKLYIEENKVYYETVNKLNGKYFKYEESSDKYHHVWFVYVYEVNNPTDNVENAVEIKGKSVCLSYTNNYGEKGTLVTYTYDVDSSYGISLEWSDAYSGYFKFSDIKMSTEEEFQLAKDKIKDLN